MNRGPDDAFSHHSPRFLPHVLHLLLFSEKCICYRPAAAAAKTDLCCPSARCAGGMTKPVHDDHVGKSRNGSMPKCPIIALVNHVKGDKAPKRHPTQRGSHGTVCQTAVIYHADKHTFFFPRGNSRMHNATYLLLHIYRSQAESQLGEALRNQEMQKRKLLQKERGESDFWASWGSVKSNELFTHRLPRSTLLHWLLIYIFWFIEAHASYFNQGSPYHTPSSPSSHWLPTFFSPTMHINSKKYNQFYDRLCF